MLWLALAMWMMSRHQGSQPERPPGYCQRHYGEPDELSATSAIDPSQEQSLQTQFRSWSPDTAIILQFSKRLTPLLDKLTPINKAPKCSRFSKSIYLITAFQGTCKSYQLSISNVCAECTWHSGVLFSSTYLFEVQYPSYHQRHQVIHPLVTISNS